MPDRKNGQFPTTKWTLISRVRSGDALVARLALDEICALYHYPLYCYIRRRGLEHHDAQDALHEFLAKLLRLDSIKGICIEQGRLRAFLSTALQRFLFTWFRDHEKQRREFSMDAEAELAEAEGRFQRERLTDQDTPELIFERKWAHELLRHVQRKLKDRYADKGKAALFEALRPALVAGGTLRGEDTPMIATSLGMTPGALRVAMSRLLDEYREVLRGEVLQTVENADDVEDEIAYMLTVFHTP